MKSRPCKECGQPATNFMPLGMDIGPMCDECNHDLNVQAIAFVRRLTRTVPPTALGDSAAMLLNALRFARDNAPAEWDALLGVDHVGHRICNAWDAVKRELAAVGYSQRHPEPVPRPNTP